MDDDADKVGEQQLEGLDAVARRRRRELRELHVRSRSSEQAIDLDQGDIDALFTLTDDVLAIEARAAEHRERERHRDSSRVIYAATAASILGSATALSLGIAFGWVPGWGMAALAITMAVGLLLAGAHAIAESDGHRARVLPAILASIAGLAVAALAPARLPWWISAIVLILLLAIAGVFVSTVSIKSPASSDNER